MYELGKWFRKRYDYFLPSEYSPKDIYVRSTDPDRCLMSAYAVLAGLFPPGGPKLWNKNLLWQPIPVHTLPIDEDEVLSMRKKCPKYINLLGQTMASDYIKNISSKFHHVFEYISENSGWDKVNIRHVAILQTILDVYSSYNRSFIPSWTRKLDKDVLTYLAAVNHQRYTLTTDLKRLLTGPFWFNLLTHFDNVISNVTDTPKFLMLSAHDTTIVSILNGMDAYDFQPPRFGATLIWELRRDCNSGVDYIHLLYKKSEAEVDTLSMGQCGTNCSYEDFKYMMAPVVAHSSDWEEYCEGMSSNFVI